MTLPAKKSDQIHLTLPLGNNGAGQKRRALWQQAALKAMYGNPKLFNAWCRAVLDAEANRLLKIQQ